MDCWNKTWKIRSSIRARAKAGLYRCSYAPFGYCKSSDNHNKLAVDGETAWIVKRIFELANAGMGAHKIVSVFREEKVPCPSWWQHTRGESITRNGSKTPRTSMNGRTPSYET